MIKNEYESISEFMSNTEIKRSFDYAEIIVDYFNGEKEKPIRLIGFLTHSNLSDFEIYEEGYAHYNKMIDEINNVE